MKNKRVIIIPVYNEEAKIQRVLESLERQADLFVLINDGSTDRTSEILDAWSSDREDVTVILIEKNKGMAFALRKGFQHVLKLIDSSELCNDDIVMTVDGDGQHSNCDINAMCNFLTEGDYDLVIGKRDFNHYPKLRITGNRIMSLYVSLLAGKKFHDVESGCRCFRAGMIRDILKYYIGCQYSCAIEISLIAARLGFNISNEWPIKMSYYRKRGPGLKHAFINIVLGLSIMVKLLIRRRNVML